MEALGTLGTERLLKIMCELIGIDEVAVHPAGHIARRHAIESVCINQTIALDHRDTVTESLRAQLLVIVVLRHLDEEITADHTVHQHGDAASLARLADKLCEVVVELRAGIRMALRLQLLVVVTKLDNDEVAGPQAP